MSRQDTREQHKSKATIAVPAPEWYRADETLIVRETYTILVPGIITTATYVTTRY